MQAIDLSHIPEEPRPANPVAKPLESPESKMSRLRTAFLKLQLRYPNSFPLLVIDPAAAGRLRCLLGLSPLLGQQQKVPKQFFIGAKSVYEWLHTLQNCIGRSGERIHATYLVGSAASYVAGRRPILRGLTELALTAQIPPGELYSALERRSKRCSFPYGDVDIHIHLEGGAGLSDLSNRLQELAVPPGVMLSVEGFDEDHMLIVRIKDEASGECLDYTLYTRRNSHYIVKRDSLRVKLTATPGEKSQLEYVCSEPWGWWRGHMLRLLERPANMPTLHHCFSRVINLQGRKGLVSIDDLEDRLFAIWEQKRCVPDRLVADLRKQLSEHENSQVGRQVNVLRVAELLAVKRPHNLTKLFKRLKPDELGLAGGSLFLYEAIRLLPKGSLAVLELAGIVALQEAWTHPFCAKLEGHGGKFVLRLRFRASFGKRDLLLRYDPAATVQDLQRQQLDWQSLRPLLHLAFGASIQQRSCASSYHQSLGMSEQLRRQIRDIVFRDCCEKPDFKHLCFARSSSLAALMLPLCTQSSEYALLASLLVSGKAGSETDRLRLLGDCLEKLLELKAYWSAADIITSMRTKQWLSEEKLIMLFVRSLKVSSPQLWQACQPEGLEIDWEACANLKTAQRSARCVAALDHPNIAAQTYLDIVSELKPARTSLSVDMLLRLQPLMPLETWSANVQVLWTTDLHNPELCRRVTCCIEDCLEGKAPLPFKQKWLLGFTQDTRRFVADETIKAKFIRYLAAEEIKAEKQEALLKGWGIKDPKLWHGVVQAYLRKNPQSLPESLKDLAFTDPASFISWGHVLQLDDAGQVETLLTQELRKSEPPGGRFAIAAAWLSRWPERRPTPRLMRCLLPKLHGANWTEAFKKHDAAHLLFALMQKSEGKPALLKLCNLVFLNLKPDSTKQEYLFRGWCSFVLELAKQTPGLIDSTSVRACMRLDPATCWTQLLANMPRKDICSSILRIGLQREHVTICELTQLLHAALEIDPTGALAADIDITLGRSNASKTYRAAQRLVACRQLETGTAKLKYAVDIYLRIGDESMHSCVISESRLFTLLRHKCPDWVVGILSKERPEQLSKLSEVFYRKLLDHALQRDLEKRAVVVLHAPAKSPFLLKDWEGLLNESSMDVALRGRLLQQSTKYNATGSKTAKLALALLSEMKSQQGTPTNDLSAFLFSLIAKLEDVDLAARLWSLLGQMPSSKRDELWYSGIRILQNAQGSCPDSIVAWLFRHLNDERRKVLIEQIPALAGLWTPQQLREHVYPLLAKSEQQESFWQLIASPRMRHVPDCESLRSIVGSGLLRENHKELITYLIVQVLPSLTHVDLLDCVRITLRYDLPLGCVLTPRLKTLGKEQFADPCLQPLLLMALGLDRSVSPQDFAKTLKGKDYERLSRYPELITALETTLRASGKSQLRTGTVLLRLLRAAEEPCVDKVKSALALAGSLPDACAGPIDDSKEATRRIGIAQLVVGELLPKFNLKQQAQIAVALYESLLQNVLWQGALYTHLLSCINPLLSKLRCAEARSKLQQLLSLSYPKNELRSDGQGRTSMLCDWIKLQWQRQDLNRQAQTTLVNAIACYQKRVQHVHAPMSPDEMLLRMAVWTNGLLQRTEIKQLIAWTASAINDALACNCSARTRQLIIFLVDLQRVSELWKYPDQLVEWNRQIQAALLMQCDKDELLENLAETLVVHPRLRTDPEPRILESWHRICSDSCALLLKSYPDAIGRLLDVLTTQHDMHALSSSGQSSLLKTLQEASAAQGQLSSEQRLDLDAFVLNRETLQASPFLQRLLQARSDLDARASSNTKRLPPLLQLWQELDRTRPHRYHIDLLAHLTGLCCIRYSREDSQRRIMLGWSGQIMLLMLKHTDCSQRQHSVGRQFSLFAKTPAEYFELERQLKPALTAHPELRSEILGLAVSSLSEMAELPNLAFAAIAHAKAFTQSLLLMYPQSCTGPMGPIAKPTVQCLRQALSFLIRAFYRWPNEVMRLDQALSVVSTGLLEARLDVTTFHRILDELAQEAKAHAVILAHEQGRVVLDRIVDLLLTLLESKKLAGYSGNPELCYSTLAHLIVLQDEAPYQRNMQRVKQEMATSIPGNVEPRFPISWTSECLNLRPELAVRYGQLLEKKLERYK